MRGNLDTLMGVLEQANFEFSRKQVNKLYDEYVLTKGDIDDRNFAHPDTELQERSQGPPNAVVNMAEVKRTSVEKTRRMVYVLIKSITSFLIANHSNYFLVTHIHFNQKLP